MPQQTPTQWRKLGFVVGAVTGIAAAIASVNYVVAGRESASDPASTQKLAAGLQAVANDPEHLSIMFSSGTPGERILKRLQAALQPVPDVMVLGQSDADHMSGTFFRSDAHFYNGFLSNSYFLYQWEVFDRLVKLGRTPQLVLWDVRNHYLLWDSIDPPPDLDPSSDVWWAGPPFRAGRDVDIALPWWKEIDSLLSLRQTQHSFHALTTAGTSTGADKGWLAGVAGGNVKPRSETADETRWLADGSRVSKQETSDAKLPPRGAVRIEDATGRRHVCMPKVQRLGEYMDRILSTGARIIVYSPPVHPASFVDPAQLIPVAEAAAEIRKVADSRRVDYCDLTTKAAELHCAEEDFLDERHLSRHCNEGVVWQLANGCAPLAGDLLRSFVSRNVLSRTN